MLGLRNVDVDGPVDVTADVDITVDVTVDVTVVRSSSGTSKSGNSISSRIS